MGRKIDNALERTGEKTRRRQPHGRRRGEGGGPRRARESAADAAADARATEPGRAMSDTAITASIKTDYLKDPDLSVLKIDVDTHDGVVTLNGLAPSDDARERAEQARRRQQGREASPQQPHPQTGLTRNQGRTLFPVDKVFHGNEGPSLIFGSRAVTLLQGSEGNVTGAGAGAA